MSNLLKISVFLFLIPLNLQNALAEESQFSSSENKLIDVGGYRLSFNVAPGSSPIILFESGGASDSSYWNEVAERLFIASNSTVITYDRAGYGKSETNQDKYNIYNVVQALENGLENLNVKNDIIVVAHSYGGFLAKLLANRNPEKILGIILVDANLSSFYTDDQVEKLQQRITPNLETLRKCCSSITKEFEAFGETVNLMRKIDFPQNIPVIDIVAGSPTHRTSEENKNWRLVHENFTNTSPSRKLIIAKGSGHNIMTDNPQLLIDEIQKLIKNIQNQ